MTVSLTGRAAFFASMLAAAVTRASVGAFELADSGPRYTGLPDTRELEAAQSRRTVFGQPLNPQSRYGLAWLPETLRVPEMDLEYSELRLDYFHSENSVRADELKAEVEHAFGSLTLEIELPSAGRTRRKATTWMA